MESQVINLSKAIVGMMDNMQKQMWNIYREMETISNNQNDILNLSGNERTQESAVYEPRSKPLSDMEPANVLI